MISLIIQLDRAHVAFLNWSEMQVCDMHPISFTHRHFFLNAFMSSLDYTFYYTLPSFSQQLNPYSGTNRVIILKRFILYTQAMKSSSNQISPNVVCPELISQ